MAGVDGDLVGGAGAVDVPLLDEQLTEGPRRQWCVVLMAAVDGDLVGGAGALDVPLLDEQLPKGQRGLRGLRGILGVTRLNCHLQGSSVASSMSPCSASSRPRASAANGAWSSWPLSMAIW